MCVWKFSSICSPTYFSIPSIHFWRSLQMIRRGFCHCGPTQSSANISDCLSLYQFFFVSLLFSFAISVKVNLGHFTATINMLMCVNRNTWLWCSSHFIPLVTKANQQSTFLLQKSQDGLLASLMNLHIPYSGGLFCDSRPFFLPKWHSSSMNWLPGHDFSELFTDSWQWRLPVGLWRSDTENADLLL